MWIVAALCIVVGFGEAFFKGHQVLFPPLDWFVASAAISLLAVGPVSFLRRRSPAPPPA